MKLTPVQKIAVELTGKNILVSAGAGTGKTRVLVERFLHLIVSQQVRVNEILALTFTEKAANEMKSRILDELTQLGMDSARRDLESAYISTIHAFAARVLREHPLEAGLDPSFRVVESEESDFLKEQALEEILEQKCEKGNAAFELLRVYGEDTITTAILKVFAAARHAGKSIQQFCHSRESGNPVFKTLDPRFRGDDMDEVFNGFNRFYAIQTWSWQIVEEFKAWQKTFSRKRGKKGQEELWKEAKAACAALLAQKLEPLAAPFRAAFEDLALGFEALYEAKKKEKAMLDFDDLAILALRLFKRPEPVHQKLLQTYRKKFRHIMVDEFQDTDDLQLELIELLSGGDNLFYVGDYKQSIYGFRGAEPALFLEKKKEIFSLDLLDNFRTEQEVLNWINEFFYELWEEDQIELAPLQPQSPAANGQVEVMVIRPGEDDDAARARMREADAIADKILELHEDGTDFKDIAILFQAMTEIGIYEQALKRRGIPYYALAGRGFYHQPEIRDMVSFLSYLENPRADIPLAASLRSPLFQIRDDSLFWLSQAAKGNKPADQAPPLAEGLEKFETIDGIPEEEKEKLRFFTRLSAEFLAVKDRLQISELLDLILEKTSYELVALGNPQGVRRYANLKKMVSIARELESLEPLSLGAFLRLLRRLQTQQVRESEAQVEAEESGSVVRLMTIHRAKGLEFPVVFVADLGRTSQSPESKTCLADSKRGYALALINPLTGDEERPQSWLEINEAQKQKDREERKRLFYVALTRAKNRLILSGAFREKKEPKESYNEMTTWMEWLMRFCESERKACRVIDASDVTPRKSLKPLVEKVDIQKLFVPSPCPLPASGAREKEEAFPLPPERGRGQGEGEYLEMIARTQNLLKRLEPLAVKPSRVIDLPVSAYVAFAKNPEQYKQVYEIGVADQDFREETRKSEIAEDEQEINAADFGTAIHAILEHMDFSAPEKSIARARQFLRRNNVQAAEAENILKAFVRSPVCQQLAKAKKFTVSFLLY